MRMLVCMHARGGINFNTACMHCSKGKSNHKLWSKCQGCVTLLSVKEMSLSR